MIFLVTLEILLQMVSYQDEQNMYALGSYTLVKGRSLERWAALYEKILSDKHSYFQYNPQTGWSHRPYSVSQDSLQHFNSQGIRGEKEYSLVPSVDTVRIVMLGNSAILSAEVADTNALGFYLEKALQAAGKKVEVVNMGVGSFGSDQTLLRWEAEGKKYAPDVVIQGVHMWDFWINLNIFKYCSHPPTGILFTKPRAVLRADTLGWVNLPTIAPEKLLDSIVIGYEKQPYFEYEYFKNSSRYGRSSWSKSYLYQIYKYQKVDYLKKINTHPKGQRLMAALLKEFAQSVEGEGAEYVMLKLAGYEDLVRMRYFKQHPNEAFWQRLEADKNVYSSFSALKNERLEEVFMASHSHYSPKGNALIAKALADYLLKNGLVIKKQSK